MGMKKQLSATGKNKLQSTSLDKKEQRQKLLKFSLSIFYLRGMHLSLQIAMGISHPSCLVNASISS